MVEGLLERLEAVLDELAAVDVDALDDTAAHDAVVASRHGWRRSGVG